MSYTHSIQTMLDTDIQNSSGIRILVSTDGGNWSDEYSISTNANLGTSELIIATQNAIKTYVDNKLSWSVNSFGVYTIDNVAIGIEPTSGTNPFQLYVNGDIRANDLALIGNVRFSEDSGLSWGDGDSSFYMGSDGYLHVDGQDGIFLKRASATIATINSHGIGIGTAATASVALAVAGTIATDTEFRVVATSSDLIISTDQTTSKHIIASTDFPIAILEEGLTGGGVIVSKGALYPSSDSFINLGTSTYRFSETYITHLRLKGNITSDFNNDTEIKNTVANKHIILKTATGTGKVKMNKALGFQLTLMNGGELDVGDKYESVAKQLVPPEMGGLELVGVYISCNAQSDERLYVDVRRQSYNSSTAPATMISSDSVYYSPSGNLVQDTGTMGSSNTVYDKDALTLWVKYAATTTKLASEVSVLLLFDLPED